MKLTFQLICSQVVVRQGYNAGQTISEIALLTGKSPALIRKWLKATGVVKVTENPKHAIMQRK